MPRAEQRRSDRTSIEIPVVVFTASDSSVKVPGVTRDISLGGMFVETTFPAAFGVTVFVGFTLPGHGRAMLVSGTVRWTSKGGMGVQFGLLGARETHAISELACKASSRRTGAR